jgi:hypothetical protein
MKFQIDYNNGSARWEWPCYVGISELEQNFVHVVLYIPLLIAQELFSLMVIKPLPNQWARACFVFKRSISLISNFLRSLNALYYEHTKVKFEDFTSKYGHNITSCDILAHTNVSQMIKKDSLLSNMFMCWCLFGIRGGCTDYTHIISAWYMSRSSVQDKYLITLKPYQSHTYIQKASIYSQASDCCVGDCSVEDRIDTTEQGAAGVSTLSMSKELETAMMALNAISTSDLNKLRRMDNPSEEVKLLVMSVGLIVRLQQRQQGVGEGGEDIPSDSGDFDGLWQGPSGRDLLRRRLLAELLVSTLLMISEGAIVVPEVELALLNDSLARTEGVDFTSCSSSRYSHAEAKVGRAFLLYVKCCKAIGMSSRCRQQCGSDAGEDGEDERSALQSSSEPAPRTEAAPAPEEPQSESHHQSDTSTTATTTNSSSRSDMMVDPAGSTRPSHQERSASRVHSILTLVRERARYR